MKHRVIIIAVLIFVAFAFDIFAQQRDFPVLKGPYLGQRPPGNKAELFAPEVITYEVHGSPSILPDEKGMLVASMSEGMKFYKLVDGVWQLQKVSLFDMPDNCNGMFLSPSGKRLYFLIWENDDENFYVSEKNMLHKYEDSNYRMSPIIKC